MEPKTRSDTVYSGANVSKIEGLFENENLIFMYKYQNDLLLDVFDYLYTLRNGLASREICSTDTFYIPYTSLRTSSASPFHQGCALWNALPPDLQHLPTLNSSKVGINPL